VGAVAKVRVSNEKLIDRPGKILLNTYRKACLKVRQDCCTALSGVLAAAGGGGAALADGSGKKPGVVLTGRMLMVELEANA